MLVSKDNYQRVVEDLATKPILACDTETSGLEHTDRLFAIILADDTNEYYFDKRILGSMISDPRGLGYLLFDTHLIFQNAKFDMAMLEREGLPVNKVSDIAVLARLVRNDHLSYKLDDQAKRYGMAKSTLVERYIKEHKLYSERTTYLGEKYKSPQFDKVPIEIMQVYACHDARLTYDLYHIYMKEIPSESLAIWETEQQLTPILYNMEKRGVQLDIAGTLKAREYEMGLILEAKERFRSMSGYNYDENNRKTLIEVFTKAGESFEYTDKGNPRIDKDALETFHSPIAAVVREIRYYEKRVSTYYDSFLNYSDSRGVIHARINQGGTTTGRFSYADPNLQNIPKEDSEADSAKPYVVRGCLVPKPGYYFVSIDYSQQEYRMMLDYANEKRMIEQVMSGVDVHQATADLLGITRKYAKTVNFAALYGAGPDKLAGMLGLSVFEARRLLDRYFMGLPMVEQFVDRVRQTAKGRGYIRNWAGRRLHCQPGFDYAMPNHLIQGGCSDVVRKAMVALKDAPIILQIHDQLVFEVPLYTTKQEIMVWKDIMESVYESKNGMKLTADVSISMKSFAERDMQVLK